MRLLVFSDLHDNWDFLEGLKKEREKADLVVCLGDLSLKYDPEIAEATLPLVDFYIPGNMDDKRTEEIMLPRHMHARILTYKPYRLVGIGYSNPTPFNTPGELSEEELLALGKRLVSAGDVLFTHAPPYNILDRITSGAHVGSKALREIVDERPPLLHVFGHIHEEIGVEKRGRSVYVNLPPAMEGGYAWIELGPEIPIVEFARMP
ncbi:MAG: YfcE family phosphodiesterase [Candidatus Micrarchaeota archaeon]|nr:YfcE family phosphodiesterase [Candidatus Micrarchaeota archaeon]